MINFKLKYNVNGEITSRAHAAETRKDPVKYIRLIIGISLYLYKQMGIMNGKSKIDNKTAAKITKMKH